MKHLTITCDMREERGGIPKILATIPGVTVESRDLLAGDFAIGSKLGIERKTAHDFVASILDGRLMEQAARLSSEYEQAIVVIEGDVYSTRSIIKSESIDGALSWLAVLSGIPVLHVPNSVRSAMLIHRIGLHVEHGLGYEVPLRANKPQDASLSAQFLIEGLPGVGPVVARRLLEHFHTPSAVFNATKDELKHVHGVGPKMAERIFETIRGQ